MDNPALDELPQLPAPTFFDALVDTLMFPVIIPAVVFCLVWLYRDARARDADPILWTVALATGAFLLHFAIAFVGVAIYLFMRPKGRLGRCPHCGSGHLEWFTICPKCEGPLKRDCSRCHATAPWDATECPECRALL